MSKNIERIKKLEKKFDLKDTTIANYLVLEDIEYEGKKAEAILKYFYQSKASKTLIVNLNKSPQKIGSIFKITDLSSNIGTFVNLNLDSIKLSPKIFNEYSSILIEEGLRGIFTVELNSVGTDAKYYISEVTPLQYLDKNKELESWIQNKKRFNSKEWQNIILETLGFNPENLLYREKVLNLMRLIPFCEKNYNLIELGPRQVGKTFHYKRGFPYSKVISGKITSANVFYNSKDKIDGFIHGSDVLVFDEFTKQVDDKSLAAPLKEFMNDGSTVVYKKIECDTSLVFQGNINEVEQKIETENQWFFDKFDSQFKDTAFFDRFNYMIPSWGLRKMQNKLYCKKSKYSIEKLFFILNSLRSDNEFSEILDEYEFKTNGTERGERSIKKTVSGLLKILHPDKKVTPQELSLYIYLALEGRYLIEKQLQKESPDEFKELISEFSLNIEGKTKKYKLNDPSKNDLEKSLYETFINKIDKEHHFTTLPHRIIIETNNRLKKIALDNIGVEENKKEIDFFDNDDDNFIEYKDSQEEYLSIEYKSKNLDFKLEDDLDEFYTNHIFNNEDFEYFLSKDPTKNYLYDYKINIKNIKKFSVSDEELFLYSFFTPIENKVIACKNKECYSEDLFVNEDFMYECEDCSSKYHLYEGKSLLISKKTLKNIKKNLKS